MSERPGLGSIAMGGLTPLLDTLFILLLALLATSEAKREDPDELVRIQLPVVEEGADGTSTPSIDRITFIVDANSQVSLLESGEVIATRAALDRALATALAERLPEEVSIELRVDGNARHAVAVDLLQHLRLQGFVDVDLVASGSDAPSAFLGEAGE